MRFQYNFVDSVKSILISNQSAIPEINYQISNFMPCANGKLVE